ncbi:MAG TPA: methylated-DNA--[protein]-cysteine S-methyltransferase [Gammaproteobacteria bacterium]
MPQPPTEPAYSAVVASPVGPLGIVTAGGAVTDLDFLPARHPLQAASGALAATAARQLARYFDDPEAPFELPLHERGTPFQRRVWAALRAIPCGQVRSYGALAAALGSGPRAVGGACRANPVVIVTPCHRVIAAGGRLGGFAGASAGAPLDCKRWLLAHEAGAR